MLIDTRLVVGAALALTAAFVGCGGDGQSGWMAIDGTNGGASNDGTGNTNGGTEGDAGTATTGSANTSGSGTSSSGNGGSNGTASSTSGDGGASSGNTNGTTSDTTGSTTNGGTTGEIPPLPAGEERERGWTYVEVDGAICRDGSPAGYFYREGSSSELMIFLNGGGACADSWFCHLNPDNVHEDLPIDLLIGGALAVLTGPYTWDQFPPEEGVFKKDDPANPVGDWNMIYVPYCTGDIHSGTNRDVEIPDVPGLQQFVGYENFGLFLDSFGAHFQEAEKVLLTGSSAGGFGSLFNYDRTQTFFDQWGIDVYAVSDSGVPFRDEYMAPCLQQRWRDYWGLNAAMPTPEECPGCFNEDGGGMVEGLGNYLFHEKYEGRIKGGFISTTQDQIIRAFFAPGLNADGTGPDNCTLDPAGNTIGATLGINGYTGEMFHEGLADVMENVVGEDTVGYYVFPNETHMHLFRPNFYETNGNEMTIAEWLGKVLEGETPGQGPLYQ